jgi:hypothetical protein
MYAEIEAKKPKLISTRINKNKVLSVSLMSRYRNTSYRIEYADNEQQKAISISVDSDGELIVQ